MRIRAHSFRLSAYLRGAYIFFLLALIVALADLMSGGGRIRTGLAELLPADAQMDALWQAADAAQDKELNAQLVFLLGGAASESAFAHAEQLAEDWRQSGLFISVDSRIRPDMAALRNDVRTLGAALLPAEAVNQLYHKPEEYFRHRAEAAFNPFTPAVLALGEDWLGFSRFLATRHTPGKLQWQADNGMLFSEEDGKTWVFARARLPERTDSRALLALVKQSRASMQAAGLHLYVGGGALFAAKSRADAERESTLMSISGITLTFALLFSVFRSVRIIVLTLPIACGMLCGLAATLALFGHIHVLTLVIGTSLIGVLVDFPLHWLTPAMFDPRWQALAAMRRIRPVFLTSLAITALGYALLWFTPLPVLKQSAVFSIAALTAAFAATALLLPPFFAAYPRLSSPHPGRADGKTAPPQRHTLITLPLRRLSAMPRPLLLLLLGALTAGGISSRWQDDIRDWISLPDVLLQETQDIARLSGLNSSGQYVLIAAADSDTLLQRSQLAAHALQSLVDSGKLDAFQSLSQWLPPRDSQRRLQKRFAELAAMPQYYAASGLPPDELAVALRGEAERAPLSLEESLQTTLGEAWRGLYLGEIDGRHAAIIRLYGVHDSAALSAEIARLALPDAVRLMDRREHLNHLFAATRNQAAWLKLASWLLAWGVLVRIFGRMRGSLILAAPLAALLTTVGILGWLAIPVGLFAMFGLLLASAIGVDYAVYILQAEDGPAAKQASITLAALTTTISFVLLAASGTPAVATFGLTVSVGVACNWLLAGVFLLGRQTMQ